MGKYDAIRAEFIAGGVTLAALAKRHGVSYTGLRTAAGRQKWSAQRAESAARSVQAIEERRARCNDVFLDCANALKTVAMQNLLRIDTRHDAKSIAHIAKAVEAAHRMVRTELGMPATIRDTPPAVRVDIGALAVALGQLQQQGGQIVETVDSGAPVLRAIG